MSCTADGTFKVEDIQKPYFVWFEENWRHDDLLHHHKKAQLVYVESGYQYLTVEGKIYLLPQNHAAWIPPDAIHKTNTHSEKIKLMIILFDVDKQDAFYHQVSVFSVPPVLREMIKYAEKWSTQLTESADENIYLRAMYNELPHFVAQALQLHITLPKDKRLKPVIDYLHAHFAEDISIEKLCLKAALTLRTMERIFKKETGLTLSKYQQIIRIIKSLELLSNQQLTISQIAYKVGYKSLQAYTNSFQSVMQYRPSEFSKRIS